MRLRRHGDDTAPLSPYADDWVTARERKFLGEEEAACLAHVRRLEASRFRAPTVPTEDDIANERPAVDSHRDDPTAIAILAGREALLDGLLMPFREAS